LLPPRWVEFDGSASQELSPDFRSTRVHPFSSQRFHALFNSLFKVLFNFPSRYLFAIRIKVIFSLGWSLPPTLGCITKQPDSTERPISRHDAATRASHPPWVVATFKSDLSSTHTKEKRPSETQHFALLTRFCAGLIPVQSPLLKESLLVSFPPLNDMLKFGG